jgi:predicted alpha-1,2-mannosidase
MKNSILLGTAMFVVLNAGIGTSAQDRSARGSAKEPTRDLVSYVDPNIGGIGHVLQPTLPTVQIPHGMIRVAPIRKDDLPDKYLADRILGFPMNIVSHRGNRAFSIMAASGPLAVDRARLASEYDHDQETATPYAYSVLLEDHDINAALTVAQHSVFYRFAFHRPGPSHLVFRTEHEGNMEILSNTTLRGSENVQGVMCYFYAIVSRPFLSSGTFSGTTAEPGRTSVGGKNAGVFLAYDFPASTVDVRVGLSYIGFEQAEENLKREIPGWDFEKVKKRGRRLWNEALGKIKVEGGTERQKRIFYTALYRSHERMVNISEYGKYYSGYDKQVHDDGGTPFYVDDWLWDSYRSLHPLQILIAPETSRDMLRSYVRMYEQSGWMPSFALFNGESPVMIGHHAASFIADAYAKGIRDFDVEKAYEGIRKNALEATMLPWASGPKTELDDVYFTRGFFPALPPDTMEWVKQVHSFEGRQAVAVTLEHSYDDWCTAQLAKELDKKADYELFMKRARNYEKVYDPRIGFMSPKTADGKWLEPFDPKLSGGPGGRAYFAECNAWTYTWSVQHDVAGLVNLMGGRGRAAERLDKLFNEPPGTAKWLFIGQFPDASGLNGQFAMGNEPSFHIPYLYNYLGQPWKTQKRVRQLMDVWYDDDPLGICGDEDGGAMSSWYVFSAMGMYPVSPGRPVYDIGSPIFSRVTLSMARGKSLVIKANNVSQENKYIQRATLNGKPLRRPWFEHADIARGGELVLEMGPRPSKQWGASPGEAPPSMSKEISQVPQAPNAQDTLCFAWITDLHFGKDDANGETLTPAVWLAQALRHISSSGSRFVLLGGDIIEESNNTAQYALFDAAMKTSLPWYPMPGNHDIGTEPSAIRMDNINAWIGRGYGRGDHNREFYGILVDSLAAFFVLNTQASLSSDPAVRARADEQLAEMDSFFTAHASARQKFVCSHVPLFIQSRNEADAYFNIPTAYRNRIMRLMDKHGVKIYLAGHRHEDGVARSGGITVYSQTALSFQLGTANRRGYYVFTVTPDSVLRTFYPLVPED